MTTNSTANGIRVTTLLRPADVVDDATLHPGAVVWLAEPRLGTPEREQFAMAAREAAMARHPAGHRRHLRAV